MTNYTIIEQTICLEDSTDQAKLVTIKHNEGEINLVFLFGELYSGESLINGIKTKIK